MTDDGRTHYFGDDCDPPHELRLSADDADLDRITDEELRRLLTRVFTELQGAPLTEATLAKIEEAVADRDLYTESIEATGIDPGVSDEVADRQG